MPKRAVLTLRREDGKVVADSVAVADTTLRRLRGVMGRTRLQPGSGMLLRPAWSIHTAFLRFPIDVVFIDPEQVVIRIEAQLPPFSTASCRGAREVVELAAGECAKRELRVGDRVTWAPRASEVEGAARGNLFGDVARPRVLVASRDARFVKLSRFLLEGRGLEVSAVVPPSELPDRVGAADADVIVLDAEALGEALRTANATRSIRPELQIVLVGEADGDPERRGYRLYHKWDETEQAMKAVEQAVAERGGGSAPTA
jgi:uncharacterized membrane protein (UPF0127 family)/CheY-like chemotaxis protein